MIDPALLVLYAVYICAFVVMRLVADRPPGTTTSERLEAWRSLADQCGLRDVTTSRKPELTARHGRLHVRFGGSTTIEITNPNRPIPLGSHAAAAADMVESGNATFDADLPVSGNPAVVHALLDATTRRLLSRVATVAS